MEPDAELLQDRAKESLRRHTKTAMEELCQHDRVERIGPREDLARRGA
jgi:hypothetical protein